MAALDWIQILDALCEVFGNCATPGAQYFVAAGLDAQGQVVVIATDVQPMQELLQKFEPALAGQVKVKRGAPFILAPGRAAKVTGRRETESEEIEARDGESIVPVTADAGIDINNGMGTLGCSLEGGDGNTYFLTAAHVVGQLSLQNGVSSKGLQRPLGTLDSVDSFENGGLDWALVKVARNIQPSNELIAETGVRLQTPMIPSDQISLLTGQTIGMSGAKSDQRRLGSVYLAPACVAVDEYDAEGNCVQRYLAPNQILVTDVDGASSFGQNGDSGAIAHFINVVKLDGVLYPLGGAIGMFWGISPTVNHYAVTPLADILNNIHSTRNLTLTLL